MFRLTMGDVSLKEVIFATAAGLRGSVSLILAQAVVTDAQAGGAGDAEVRLRALSRVLIIGFRIHGSSHRCAARTFGPHHGTCSYY